MRPSDVITAPVVREGSRDAVTAPEGPGALLREAAEVLRAAAEPAPPAVAAVSHITQIESGPWGARVTCACRGWGREYLVGRRTAAGEAIYSEAKAIELAQNAAFVHREGERE